jgi:cyclopropane fatty-acyl-phospholipid synthase-like methyltransferase
LTKNIHIDHGQEFDWGKTTSDYARYRDIYPADFYQRIVNLGLCTAGQKVLDLGTGTGVLPRNLAQFGASFIGVDISENQIEEAKRLADTRNLDIEFRFSPAETVDFPDNSFDVITACQCFMYFDKSVLMPSIFRMLKPGGRLAILSIIWLPDESDIAKQSEMLVLKYNPMWTGADFQRKDPSPPAEAQGLFEIEHQIVYDIHLSFTRESWNGRIRACRGVGASLSEELIKAFDNDHRQLLKRIAPEAFDILHYVTMLILKVKK